MLYKIQNRKEAPTFLLWRRTWGWRLFAYALLFSLASCKSCKKEVNPDPLPPETQTGANTFGCLIDGQPWIPNGGGGFSGIKPTSVTGVSGKFIKISGDANFPDRRETINILINDYKTVGRKKLQFDTPKFPNSVGIDPKNYGEYIKRYSSPIGEIVYTTNANIGGYVEITKFDEINGVISGIFEFDAIDEKSGKVIRITKGRFDLK